MPDDQQGARRTARPAPRPVLDSRKHPWLHRWLVAFLLTELAVAGYVLISIWDPVAKAGTAGSPDPATVTLFGFEWSASVEQLYLLTVIALGAVGSNIHALTSVATYLGDRKLRHSWTVWYLVRLPVGISLALIFYFLLRGGVFSVGAEAGDVNPYGIGAIAALAGMFSKQATDKLQETFDTLFRTSPTEGDAVRGDSLLQAGTGTLTVDLLPASLPVGAPDPSVQVVGGFTAGDVVRAGTAERSSRLVSSSQLEVRLTAEDVSQPGVLVLQIDPSDPTAAAAEARLRIRPRVDRVSMVDRHDPLLVQVDGAGFANGVEVTVGGEQRRVEAWQASSLKVRLLDGDRADAANRQLQVTNPPEHGGDADPAPLTGVWP